MRNSWVNRVLLASVLVLGLGHQAQAQVVLFDNLPPADVGQGAQFALSASDWLSQRFTTGGGNYSLTKITLSMARTAGTGQAVLSIYTGTTSAPVVGDGLIGTLTTSDSYTISNSNMVFTPTSSISLNSGTNYWVTLKGVNGTSLQWGYARFNTIAGPGAAVENAFSFDSGGSWTEDPGHPYQMKVEAVPEPSSFVLAGLGLGAMGMIRRRMKKRVTPDQVPSV